MNTPVFGQNPGFPLSVHTAPPDISVYDAARLMGWRKVGVIVVVQGHQPVGVVTDRDLATRVLGNGLDARSVRVGRVMTKPLVFMKQEESDEQILDRMQRSRVRQVPLVDGAGNLIGLAALEATGDGRAGMAVVRSTQLVPMVKRKRWRRLAFRLKQETAVNLRWIGATMALAAIGGVVSLIAVGHWTPWASQKTEPSSQVAPPRAAAERPVESPKSRLAEPPSSQAASK
jgi:CBS domain-containing protein